MSATIREHIPRAWNAEHAVLRHLLENERDWAQALPVFLEHHQVVHSAKLTRESTWSCQDQVLAGLTEMQMRCIPKGRVHSVAWEFWHITRIEDATMNILLAGAAQVLVSGGWLAKLGVSYTGVGNEQAVQETAEFSSAINLNALFAYRLAVGKGTRAIVRRLKPDVLWECPPAERMHRLVTEKAVDEHLDWLLHYWGEHPSLNLLLMPATRHPFVHLNEIARMLPKLSRCNNEKRIDK